MKIYDQKDLAYSGWDVEFDTVIGRIGGSVLLTIILLPSQVLIARLMKKKDQNHVCDEFDRLEKILKKNREICVGQSGIWWFFTTMLTDRGTEMADFRRLERSLFSIKSYEHEEFARTCVFYTDPYSSWQKPHIEEVHTLIRRILPKGSSFDGLTQKDIDLVCSHVNSYSRAKLDGATPFEVAPAGFSDKLMRALGQKRIDPDDINLTPRLLDY